MNKKRWISILILVIHLHLLTGCTGTSDDKEDILAVLKDEEIQAKDVLALYPLDDEYLEIYLKEKIIVIEAKKMGIHVSDEEIEEDKQSFSDFLQLENKEFHEKQSAELGITPEEYYEIWQEAYYSQNLYIQKYMAEKFLNPALSEGLDLMKQENLDVIDKKIEEHLENLYKLYKENGELTLK